MIGFWGCGMRDETPIDPELMARCRFMGVRGPLTRDGLGLPQTPLLAIRSLLMPLIYRPKTVRAHRGRTLCMPRFLDPLSTSDLLRMTGADAVVRPGIRARRHALLDTIDAIAGADFILAEHFPGPSSPAPTACLSPTSTAVTSTRPSSGAIWPPCGHSPTSFVTGVASGRSLRELANPRRPAHAEPGETLALCAPIPAHRSAPPRQGRDDSEEAFAQAKVCSAEGRVDQRTRDRQHRRIVRGCQRDSAIRPEPVAAVDQDPPWPERRHAAQTARPASRSSCRPNHRRRGDEVALLVGAGEGELVGVRAIGKP